jgi:hypothetical protein
VSLGSFQTAFDFSRTGVTGSIDPLGQLSIWIHFGRKIVGNLTTVANSARDFGVLPECDRMELRITGAGEC